MQYTNTFTIKLVIKFNGMKRIVFCIVFLLSNCFVWSQQSVNSSGENVTNSYGSFSYSIGQIFYLTNYSNGYSMIQGVQQPFEISVLGVDDNANISLEIKVYPNPTTSILFLKVENTSQENIEYYLFDTLGRNVQKGKVSQKETPIDFSQKESGVYFIKISSSSGLIKTFKIIKK